MKAAKPMPLVTTNLQNVWHLVLSAAIFFFASSACADDCDKEARRIAKEIGATVGKQANRMVGLSAPEASEVTYGCAPGAFLAMFGTGRSLNRFLEFVGQAGKAFVDLNPNDAQAAAETCIRTALVSKDGEARVKALGYVFDCVAGPKWGGTKVTIEIP